MISSRLHGGPLVNAISAINAVVQPHNIEIAIGAQKATSDHKRILLNNQSATSA
jgi:hypothetical protein